MAEIRLNPHTCAILVVDVQPTFMPGGELPVPEGDAIVDPGRRLLERLGGIPAVATQDWHPADHISFASQHAGKKPFDTIQLYGHEQTLWPDHAVQGTSHAALATGLPLDRFDLILRKGTRRDIDSYSAFRENYGPDGKRGPTGLAGYLRERGVEKLLLWGLALDVCVAWSARDAVASGFETLLLVDLCRAVEPDKQDDLLECLQAGGAQVTTSDSVDSS